MTAAAGGKAPMNEQSKTATDRAHALFTIERWHDDDWAVCYSGQLVARRKTEEAAIAARNEYAAPIVAAIDAAVMATHVAWVKAHGPCQGNLTRCIAYLFNVPGYYEAALVEYAANHGEDIAAAIELVKAKVAAWRAL